MINKLTTINYQLPTKKQGFSVIEVVIDIAIIGLVAAAILSAYSASFKMMDLSKSKIAAVALANEKMEEIRNMPYDNLATEHGPIYPAGILLDNQEIERQGVRFNVHTVISYIDDPFDGCGDVHQDGTPDSACLQNMPAGKPTDLYPYDYKQVEITVSKIGRSGYLSRITSNVAAKAAETPGSSGIIKLCVIDSNSLPVPGATVSIQNPDASPAVNMSNLTVGNDGCIMVPNLPPTTQNEYHLTATMAGYSTDFTSPRTPQNPNQAPYNPDVDVSVQQVTPQTLIIDKLSTLNIDFVDETGAPIPNLAFHLQGAKKLYFNPETFKYSADLTSDANGHLALTNIEFDDYTVSIPGRYVLSSVPYQPVGLKANQTLSVKVISSTSSSLPRISKCDPLSGKIGEIVFPTISGANFASGATVKLMLGATEISGTNVVVSHDDTIEAEFNLAGATEGIYDIVVTNLSGSSVRQERGFEVKTQ